MLNLRCVQERNAAANHGGTPSILPEIIPRTQMGRAVRLQGLEVCDGKPLPPLRSYKNGICPSRINLRHRLEVRLSPASLLVLQALATIQAEGPDATSPG